MRADRLVSLVLLLRQRGQMTAPALAHESEVSTRTVRDIALLAAGSGSGEQVFGLGSALASGLRKVVDALPESHRATASDAVHRILIDPEIDLLSRRHVTDEVPDTTMIEIRRAVLSGHKLRIHYAASGKAPQWRIVDALDVLFEEADTDGWLRLQVTFQDSRHTEWAMWQLATDVEVLAPQWLRACLYNRAAAIATRYQVPL